MDDARLLFACGAVSQSAPRYGTACPVPLLCSPWSWRDVLRGIWGRASENGGSKIIKAAPAQLWERYEQIFC
ncbi:MAG: hypothetical protein V8R75_12045 [Oscillospiraceae bacterium]